LDTKTNTLPQPPASIGYELSAITEASAGVVGNKINPMETYQDFTDKGTAVVGGTSGNRIWTDKSYVPITLKSQCIDCLHCVVACPHHAIGYQSEAREASGLIQTTKNILKNLPGFHFEDVTNHSVVHKSDTNYNFCKGCFVCASACPVDAIHFVPKDFINYDEFHGSPVEVEDLKNIFLAPKQENLEDVDTLIAKGKKLSDHKFTDQPSKDAMPLSNGSTMLGEFTIQAKIDMVTMFPITPNTSLLKILEDKVKFQSNELEYPLHLRTCLSEESGYAWLTGGAVKGKRCMMAQGSQSMAQLYEFMNINPGLHLPVLMLEMTRAIAPGCSIKPDHTTTMRTSDTGEIIIFGRSIKDNYYKALLLLKLMETKNVWTSGRLVIKGFVETHALVTNKQIKMDLLSNEAVDKFLGRPKNPFIFDDAEPRSIGTLDFDARYGEQRQAIDQVLINAGENFNAIADELAEITNSAPLQKVDRFPIDQNSNVYIISLNDPDMHTAELVAEELNNQEGLSCGVISINLYRPFPAVELREKVKGAKAVAILEYNNRSGRAGGAQFADEVRSALYLLENPPEIMAIQVGLGGRAVTVPYILKINQMLHDLISEDKNTITHQWLEKNSTDNVLSFGMRGNLTPETTADFDVPISQNNISQMVIVGKGGQGVLLLNGILAGFASVKEMCALTMVGYGALQRGGGITLSFKYSNEKIRDYSDIILTDTLVSFEDDIHLEAMLPQLKVGGTLIIDGKADRLQELKNMLPEETKIIIIPAKEIAIKLYNNATRTNVILLGAILAHMGFKNEEEIFESIESLSTIAQVSKEAGILKKPDSITAILSGYYAYKAGIGEIDLTSEKVNNPSTVENFESFQKRILPPDLLAVANNPKALRRKKRIYQFKKKMYQLMFQLHPMVSQIQSMYLALNGKTPISGGDMACGGCGQINIFRNLFNFLYYLQKEKGQIFISEQDGCGTVFSGMNRTSIWNMPYIRIAFETAHGVASGLADDLTKDDIVVSISGDGGMMQGIRSVEDALHHQDPILHLVVVNQTLGNTGGQSTATTMVGTKTRDGHIAQQHSINFLKLAEKHHVQGAFASTTNLSDFYKKIRWGHKVVKEERKPFLLIMNFSCLEQGINLAKSLILQKMALDCHYFNLYSLKYKEIKNSEGATLYYKKDLAIDYYPWTFGKKAWKTTLLKYAKEQVMMKELVDNPDYLEQAYGQLLGQWQELKNDMGPIKYYWGMFKNAFSLSRVTMMRIIKKTIPREAE